MREFVCRPGERIAQVILAVMVYVIGMIVSAFVVLVAFGALTGRIRINGCCASADPRLDLRMRSAFKDEDGAGARVEDPNPVARVV